MAKLNGTCATEHEFEELYDGARIYAGTEAELRGAGLIPPDCPLPARREPGRRGPRKSVRWSGADGRRWTLKWKLGFDGEILHLLRHPTKAETQAANERA